MTSLEIIFILGATMCVFFAYAIGHADGIIFEHDHRENMKLILEDSERCQQCGCDKRLANCSLCKIAFNEIDLVDGMCDDCLTVIHEQNQNG